MNTNSFRSAYAFVAAHKLAALVIVAALVLTLSYACDACHSRRQAARTAAHDAAENATDAGHEQKVGEQLKDADAHEASANEAAVERRVAESNANHADERRAEANANARQTEARDRATREAYEKALNGNAALQPDLSDADLCAELRRRGRECSK